MRLRYRLMTAILAWTAWAWTLAADVPLAPDLKADRGELSEPVVRLPPEFCDAHPDRASGEGSE